MHPIVEQHPSAMAPAEAAVSRGGTDFIDAASPGPREARRREQHLMERELLLSAEVELLKHEVSQLLGHRVRQERQLHVLLENLGRGVCVYDGAGRVALLNGAFTEMFGADAAFAVGQPIEAVFKALTQRLSTSGEGVDITDPTRRTPRSCDAMTRRDARLVLQVCMRDGRIIVFSCHPIGDGGCVQTFADVTAWRLADATVARLASHDALTDLPNRVMLRTRLEQALQRDARAQPVVVMCLDLDRFKTVNDTLGHPAGDTLLRQVARRLKDNLRAHDVVARLGGDEFAVLLSESGSRNAAADLGARLVRALEAPYDLDGQTAIIGVSIGIARAPEDGDDAVTLLKRADLALYRAKTAGRGRYCFFEAEMDVQAQKRRTVELALRRALAEGEFALHFQPVMDARQGRVRGFEALLRWNHATRGQIPPNDFIPLAEELGLIVSIGEWVLAEGCRVAATWPAPLRVAINVSVRQFADGAALVRSVARALAQSGLAAARLDLEITESVLMEDSADVLTTLHQLKALGVHIVMDDFGVGYSSLSYLRSFPFDKVKIDRSFIKEICHKPDAVAIVRAVTSLCQSLGMGTTAEGVESQEQLDLVKQESCTEVQGYLFSRPVPARDVPALLGRLQAHPAPPAAG